MDKRNHTMFTVRCLFASAVAVFALRTSAGEPPAAEQLREALRDTAAFTFGARSDGLTRAEQIAFAMQADAAGREAAEGVLIEALNAAQSADLKRVLCRILRVAGTKRCVPALEALLVDAEVSHMACYALGRMEAAEAGAALHRAAGKTDGDRLAGIINALADRGYEPARKDFPAWLGAEDPAVAAAAARGLGLFGGADAVQTLATARRSASPEFAIVIDNALLQCAEGAMRAGKPGEADRIFEEFRVSDRPEQFRFAGLRGVVLVRGERAAEPVLEAVAGKDPDVARSAVSLIPMVAGREATLAFAAAVPTLPEDLRALVLRALGLRGDSAAAPALAKETRSSSEAVRIAALEALGGAGDATVVPDLLAAAAEAKERSFEKDVARTSLALIADDRANALLLAQAREGKTGVRVEAIHALGRRFAADALPTLFAAARDEDRDVREEAISAIGFLGVEDALPGIVDLTVTPVKAGDRTAIEKAARPIIDRIGNPARAEKPILAAWAGAPGDARPALVRLLGKAAGPESLRTVREAVGATDGDLRDAAVRALADWPNPEPAEDLLSLARTADSQVHKVVAIRGYVRMASLSADPTAMYTRALDLAERTDDRKLVLGGLGNESSTAALDLVEKSLADPDLCNEAGLAAVQIASRIRDRDAARVKASMRKVVASVRDEEVRKQALEVVNDLEKFDGHILNWVVSGPYTLDGKQGADVYDEEFDAEKDPDSVTWKPLDKGVGSWNINLEGMFGTMDHCGAYARTRIWSPDARKARLEFGADDGPKVWLNGKLVHKGWRHSANAPRQVLTDVELKEGWNVLLMKIVDHEGGWEFCCRVRGADGAALDDLKIEAK